MDNFGIFDFLSGLGKFYQENKSDFISTKPKQDDSETTASSDGEKRSSDGFITTNKNDEKPTVQQKTVADVPTVFISQKLFDVIAKHDEFVKRVNEANPPKVVKKRTKRQPKTTDGNNDNNIEK
jgi:hypothetical protein